MIRTHPFPSASSVSSSLVAPGPALVRPVVTLGIAAVDAQLGGGLAAAALHEFYADNVEDGSAAAAFALLVAMRGCAPGRPVLWVREDRGVRYAGRLYAPGFVALGFDPGALVLVTAPDTLSVLKAGADLVKCGQIGAVVIEPWGKAPQLDLTASRRLAMAAAVSGVLALMVRIDASPVPSAAQTRWQVAAAPSTPLAANAPGYPAFDIGLLRHRGGIAGFNARVEWNRDERCFAPLSGGLHATAAVGADQTQQAA